MPVVVPVVVAISVSVSASVPVSVPISVAMLSLPALPYPLSLAFPALVLTPFTLETLLALPTIFMPRVRADIDHDFESQELVARSPAKAVPVGMVPLVPFPMMNVVSIPVSLSEGAADGSERKRNQ